MIVPLFIIHFRFLGSKLRLVVLEVCHLQGREQRILFCNWFDDASSMLFFRLLLLGTPSPKNTFYWRTYFVESFRHFD